MSYHRTAKTPKLADESELHNHRQCWVCLKTWSTDEMRELGRRADKVDIYSGLGFFLVIAPFTFLSVYRLAKDYDTAIYDLLNPILITVGVTSCALGVFFRIFSHRRGMSILQFMKTAHKVTARSACPGCLIVTELGVIPISQYLKIHNRPQLSWLGRLWLACTLRFRIRRIRKMSILIGGASIVAHGLIFCLFSLL